MTSWPRLSVDSVCELVKGGVDPQRYPAELFAHYSIPALDDGNGPAIELGEAIKSQKTVIENGVVLVSKLNPRIPRVWLVDDEQARRRICSTEFVPLKPDPTRLDLAYLAFAMRFALADGQISGSTSAATKSRERAKPNDLLRLTLPLPPLQEQLRIVDLLSRAEGIVQLRREAEKKAAELIPALFLDMFGDPATNPKGWATQPIRNLVSFVSGGTPSKSRDDFWIGDLPWVSPKDMKRVGIDDAIDHVNRKVLTETSIKLIPIGSVLIVVRGMILIHTVPVGLSSVPLTINQDMKALVPKGQVSGDYLLWLLKVCQPRLLGMVATAAHGTKKLETDDLERFVVPVPAMVRQTEFASRVREIESIQLQQANATAKAQATFDSLLATAFSQHAKAVA